MVSKQRYDNREFTRLILSLGKLCNHQSKKVFLWLLYPPHLSHVTMYFLNQHVGDNSIVSQRNPDSDVRLASLDSVIGLRSEELCGPQKVGSHVVGRLFTVDFDAA